MGAVFHSSHCVAVLSELLARWHHQPVIVFLTPGIIPLVPGSTAYLTMLAFVQQDYAEGVVLFSDNGIFGWCGGSWYYYHSSIFRNLFRTKHVRR